MKLDFKAPKLNEKYLEDVNNYDIKVAYCKSFAREITECVDIAFLLFNVVSGEKRKLGNASFVELISKIYDIKLEYKDYLKILSNYYNKNFVAFTNIHTLMVKKVVRDVYGEQVVDEVLSFYKVAYTDDALIMDRYNYSVMELRKLVEEKKIVIVEEMTTDCFLNSRDYAKREEYQHFDVFPLEHCKCEDSIFNQVTLKYIKSNINKSKTREGLLLYLKSMKNQIYNIKENEKRENALGLVAKSCIDSVYSRRYLAKIESLIRNVR